VARLVSWNVNARTRDSRARQAEALVTLEPDLVALQEITASNVNDWSRALRKAGLRDIRTSLDKASVPAELQGPRRFGVLTASRWAIESMPTIPGLPWPERILSTAVRTPFGHLELHNAYIPLGEIPGDVKIHTLESLFAALARPVEHHRLLCGDMNAPRIEYADGRVLTWAQNEPTGTIVRSRGPRFDSAERNIIVGLAEYDLCDTFRAIHGYAVQAESWASTYRGRRSPRRLDHIFASTSMGATSISYLDDWHRSTVERRALSDHAPMLADFGPEILGHPASPDRVCRAGCPGVAVSSAAGACGS
jgi:exonuclease III